MHCAHTARSVFVELRAADSIPLRPQPVAAIPRRHVGRQAYLWYASDGDGDDYGADLQPTRQHGAERSARRMAPSIEEPGLRGAAHPPSCRWIATRRWHSWRRILEWPGQCWRRRGEGRLRRALARRVRRWAADVAGCAGDVDGGVRSPSAADSATGVARPGSGTGRMTPSLASTFGGPAHGVEPSDKAWTSPRPRRPSRRHVHSWLRRADPAARRLV